MLSVINGIVWVDTGEYIQVRCYEYKKKGITQKYEKPLKRTAKQKKSLMGFTQNY